MFEFSGDATSSRSSACDAQQSTRQCQREVSRSLFVLAADRSAGFPTKSRTGSPPASRSHGHRPHGARGEAMFAARLPSIPDPIGAPNNIRDCATVALAERLGRAADALRTTDPPGAMLADRAARRLARCAHAGLLRTWRCEAPYCPRCARRVAIRYRRRLEARIRFRAASGVAPYGFALLTLTVAASDPIRGHTMLCRARSRLFRTAIARSCIAGGEGHCHVDPACGGDAAAWNAHLHAIVELRRRFRDIDAGGLRSAWNGTLAYLGARGSLDLRQQDNLTAESLRSCKDEAPT
jgi:hypothetical protein